LKKYIRKVFLSFFPLTLTTKVTNKTTMQEVLKKRQIIRLLFLMILPATQPLQKFLHQTVVRPRFLSVLLVLHLMLKKHLGKQREEIQHRNTFLFKRFLLALQERLNHRFPFIRRRTNTSMGRIIKYTNNSNLNQKNFFAKITRE